MNKRIPALISTISNSFCDFTLDIAVNKYNMYLVLFGTSLGSFIIQIFFGLIYGISFTSSSIIYIIVCGICILLGFILYTESLKRLPVALTGLIDSGGLFFFLIIDSFLGYIKINLHFIFLFIVFITSIFLFSYDTYTQRNIIKNKNIRISGILMIIGSTFFYDLTPYLIKIANNHGANEIAINLGYYAFSVPFFLIMLLKSKNKTNDINKNNKDILKFIILISIFEAFYYIFGTIGYINEATIINAIIQELRVFLLFILSIIFNTDKLTTKKVIAIILGIISIIGIYLY